MLPLISTLPLHNLHLLLSESIYRQQHVCSNLLTLTELQGLSGNYTLSQKHFVAKLLVFPYPISNILGNFNNQEKTLPQWFPTCTVLAVMAFTFWILL